MMRLSLSVVAMAFVVACASASAGGGGAKPKAKSGGKRQITTLASWVDVDPFTVSIVQREVVAGTFMVTFGIDVPDDALRAKAESILPRLRNNWLLTINQYASRTLRPRSQPDIDGLSTRLQRVTDETLGKPGAKVLLGNVISMVK